MDFKLKMKNIDFTLFREPDRKNEITSITCQLDEENKYMFEKLKLMGA